MTTLENGTFLVVGKAGPLFDEKLKAWIYNADGSLKAEQVMDVPDPGPGNPADSLDLLAIDHVLVGVVEVVVGDQPGRGDMALAQRRLVAIAVAEQFDEGRRFHALCFSLQVM